MHLDSELLDMIAKVVAVNAVAALLLWVLSYATSALMLEGLASLEKWLDSTLKPGQASESGLPSRDDSP